MDRFSSFLFVILGAAVAVAAQAATMYCCTDGGGHQTCADVLPQACYGRAYREISESGTRQIEAPLSAEQKVQHDAEAKRKRDAERAMLDERRRNQALLNTYGSVEDIDYMRDHALSGIERELNQARANYNDTLRQRQQLNKEASASPNNAIPNELAARLRVNDAESKAQLQLIESKQQDMEGIKAKFEAERKRYLDLTGASGKRRDAPTGSAMQPR